MPLSKCIQNVSYFKMPDTLEFQTDFYQPFCKIFWKQKKPPESLWTSLEQKINLHFKFYVFFSLVLNFYVTTILKQYYARNLWRVEPKK